MRVIESITNEQLVAKYGFKVVGIASNYDTKKYDIFPYGSLEYKDQDGLGLSIWHSNRSVQIILGSHAEYGCCPIPPLLVQMLKDGIII